MLQSTTKYQYGTRYSQIILSRNYAWALNNDEVAIFMVTS